MTDAVTDTHGLIGLAPHQPGWQDSTFRSHDHLVMVSLYADSRGESYGQVLYAAELSH